MKNIMLLDCALREAPIEKSYWGEKYIGKVLRGLELSGIDLIEIGILKNEKSEKGSTVFKYVEEVIPYISKKNSGAKYVALVDYGRYDLNNLSSYDGKSIDIIRVCFKHNEIGEVLEYAQRIREKGYQVCIQHVDTMGYDDDSIKEFVEKINAFKPLAYSIVDTFGAMYTRDVDHYVDLVTNLLDEEIYLGIHCHNNMMLADANSQYFVDKTACKRKVIIDSSLFGCGRGAGNAHTELMALFLNKNYGANYNINEILDLIDTVISQIEKRASWGYSLPYLVSGVCNAHTFNVNRLLKRHNLKSKDIFGIIEQLDDEKKKEYDYVLLEKLYVQYFDKKVDDAFAINDFSSKVEGKTILLLGPGESVKSQADIINKFIADYSPIIIGVNNDIQGYRLDYIFFSSTLRYVDYKNTCENEVADITLLITSSIKEKPDVGELIFNYISLIKSGWTNIDSSMILLVRLLIKCGVRRCYCAGLDGFQKKESPFYEHELDTNLDEQSKKEITEENKAMLKDIKDSFSNFNMIFLTDSPYSEVFCKC